MSMILLAQWLVILAAAIFALVRGADYFVAGARNVGASFGLSTFAIGVLIVGFGTSLPETASSIAAVLSDSSQIVVANAVGSNIANILLVAGVLAFFGGKIILKKDLIKTELPIFFIATTHFTLVVADGAVERTEGVLLLGTFVAYLWYLFYESKADDDVELKDTHAKSERPKLDKTSIIYVVGGLVAVLIGAKYTVDMVINIATVFSLPVGLVSITAIALGTSLPELFIAIQAIRKNQTEMAIGNIFGSNAFNMLIVVGLPTLISPLIVGPLVTGFALHVLLAASAILFVNGLAGRIMRWEGLMFLLFFAFFLLQLVDYV